MTGVHLTVDGQAVEVEAGATILDALSTLGHDTPTLCFTSTLAPANACRACVVETGPGALVPACSRAAEEGMEVTTAGDRVRRSRRMVFELLGSSVDLSLSEDMARWSADLGADPTRFGPPEGPAARQLPRPGHHEVSDAARAASVAEPVKVEDDLYIRDYAKCILCYRCVQACGEDHQNTFAIAVAGRGFDARISTEFDAALPASACVYCGNCIAICPTGALMGKVEFDLREAAAWDPDSQQATRTVCGYCGVGCNLDVVTQDGAIVSVSSPADHDVTLGNLCIKGRFGWAFARGGG